MKIDISISLKDELGELKSAVVKLNEAVEQAYEKNSESQDELKLNQLDVHIPSCMYGVPSPNRQTLREAVDNMENEWNEEMEKVKRVANMIIRPKLNAADLLFQGLYGSCDFEGINSEVLDKHFKVVRVPGFVYYKMNKGVAN